MFARTAVAVAATALAVPSAALAAHHYSPPPADGALHPSGHLTRDGRAVRALEERRRHQRRRDRRRHAPASTASAPLQAIAACESGSNPSANTGNGFYGKYQFTMETWQSVGGTGNPAAASEADQERRAPMLYAQAGIAPWPVGGR